ncbi:hypothetical protein MTR_1g069225 [Medicago truncatula]|uniref:Uncharacterized protein n=1 Tax=Medicago truncatula TaxID=3880 RepID=A0A072VWI1_MEDTR|nr:hypothetical protein MTR_1g069225 [Medicago truncatula]
MSKPPKSRFKHRKSNYASETTLIKQCKPKNAEIGGATYGFLSMLPFSGAGWNREQAMELEKMNNIPDE